MAYVKQRGNYFRAEVVRKGYKPAYASFDTLAEAKRWARDTEAAMEQGKYHDHKLANNTSLRDALLRYREEVTDKRSDPYAENLRIDKWLASDLSYRMLGNLRGSDFVGHRDTRRKAGRAENTIRLELAILKAMFRVATREWKMEGLQNPLSADNFKMPSGSAERDRRLTREEFVRIKRYLRRNSNPFAIHAFILAIETSLRQGTLFKLKWEWVDFRKSVINIPIELRRTENKGVPAQVPISTRTVRLRAELTHSV